MFLSKHQTLEDRVVQALLGGPQTLKALSKYFETEGYAPSLRAIYKAVTALIAADVAVKAGKVVRINQEWLRTARARLAVSPVPALASGEKMALSFSSLAHLDAFWKTIALGLEEYERDGRIFFYNPHDFWAHIPGRKESEEAYYRHFAETKTHAFFTIGGATTADLELKRQYQNEYFQIDAREIPALGRNSHISILGDHVITVRMSKGFSSKIDALYDLNLPARELAPQLEALYQTPVRTRFVLEHNPLKAKKLIKTLSKNFYFWKPS